VLRKLDNSTAKGTPVKPVIFATLLVAAIAHPAFAQRDRLLVEPSTPVEWGLTFGLTPRWDIVPAGLAPLAGLEPEDMTSRGGPSSLKGTDWSIGFARGRAVGGDWGISFVQQRLRRDSVLDHTGACGGSVEIARCFGEYIQLTGASVIGPEFHLNVPIVTIRERVQIGLALAGGAGIVRGTATVDQYDQTFNGNGTVDVVVTHREGNITDVAADQIFTSNEPWAPIGRIQPGVAFIVSPRIKVSVHAGFNYPGTTTFRIGATYFFPRAAP
jgi:hypothetical protein